ncbi:hypothetical protein DLAC_01929 [Tieghemostelium lacteum]|uniref:Transcription initiation factor TFIID subunit 12 domain-containing protein n=1 Tax=Tieghemostelium lacteum TaxID=361077 RepID=A0A152A525_TIELA|nr:hypothetical protein DLAC_01929 [Tieghemostelium lacteum]|eukprot:KYR01339.1 hypothetical protein DLAC_01929 [Tieghemostelium lacteum]
MSGQQPPTNNIYKTSPINAPIQQPNFKNIPIVQQSNIPNQPSNVTSKMITNPYMTTNSANPILNPTGTTYNTPNINRNPSSPTLNVNQSSNTTSPGLTQQQIASTPPTSTTTTPGNSSIDSHIDSVLKKHHNLVGSNFSPVQNISSPGLGNPSTPPISTSGSSYSTPYNTTTTTTTTTTTNSSSGSIVTKNKKLEKEKREKEMRDREAMREQLEREQRERDFQSGRIVLDSNELLGKRKLSELLSQISPNEKMDEEVEEILSIVADDFIETVSSFACSLAKHRNSNTLEVKDIQCHLERAWNIKIPGFGNPEQTKSYKKPHYPDSHKLRIQTMKKAIQLNQSLTRRHIRLTEQQQQMNRE